MVEYLSGDHVIHRMMTPNLSESEVLTEYSKTASKPKLIIRKNEKGVLINFEKNHADSIRIFSKRTSEEKFTLLAEISETKYLDTRPNTFNAPEIREYMASYVKEDMPMGQLSDIVLIIKK